MVGDKIEQCVIWPIKRWMQQKFLRARDDANFGVAL